MKTPSLMRRPIDEPLLLPVSMRFLWFSLILAWLINLVLATSFTKFPDILTLVLFFWGIRESRKMGMWIAFFFGLLMDTAVNSPALGLYALQYCLILFIAISLHRRMLWFGSLIQAIYLLPIIFGTELIFQLLKAFKQGGGFDWSWVIGCCIAMLIWPILSWILLLPQKRSVDRDENRPI